MPCSCPSRASPLVNPAGEFGYRPLLGREVYGEDFEKFLATPRRSLDWETPTALLERGENERVMQILVRVANGDFG